MTLSKAERAALRALLARAESGEELDTETARSILTEEQFVRFGGLFTVFVNADKDRYSEAVAKELPKPTTDVYFDNLFTQMRQFRSMTNRLPGLTAKLNDYLSRVKSHEDFLATAKDDAWKRYNALPADVKCWLDSNSAEDGWPPARHKRHAPFEAVFPGEMSPRRRAITQVLRELLDDEAL